MLAHERAAAVQAEFHYGTEEFGLGDYLRAYVRLLDVVDEGRCRQAGRVVHVEDLALHSVNLVGNVRNRGDDVHVEFAEQPLLDDFEVEQAEESAAET